MKTQNELTDLAPRTLFFRFMRTSVLQKQITRKWQPHIKCQEQSAFYSPSFLISSMHERLKRRQKSTTCWWQCLSMLALVDVGRNYYPQPTPSALNQSISQEKQQEAPQHFEVARFWTCWKCIQNRAVSNLRWIMFTDVILNHCYFRYIYN